MDKKRDQNLFNEPFVIDSCKIFLLILTSYFARHVQEYQIQRIWWVAKEQNKKNMIKVSKEHKQLVVMIAHNLINWQINFKWHDLVDGGGFSLENPAHKN